MSTPEDIVRRLNSEDCELAIGLCLREYRERDCWLCILKEYTNEVYNQALEDIKSKIDDEYYDSGYGNYYEVEMIVRMIEQIKR